MEQFDVVVIGTGAAGLTAAVVAAEEGARVGVFEKADLVGGTAAWSGGQVWIPNNPHMREIGIADDREQSDHLHHVAVACHLLDADLVEAYVDAGPEMIALSRGGVAGAVLRRARDARLSPRVPRRESRGRPNHRVPDLPVRRARRVGRPGHAVAVLLEPHITMSETPLGKAIPDPPDAAELARRLVRDERGCGQALIGRLLRACLDRSVEPRTGWAARELIMDGNAVVGVTFDSPEGTAEVAAVHGVILGSGGFEWAPDLCRAFLRGPMTHPVSIQTNTGDGLRMSMKAGAMLANMREAWWIPVASVPIEENPMGRVLINGQRTLPHSIMVNKRGRRFTNEAANYNAFGGAFHVEDVSRFEYANLPCWLVFDQNYAEKYGFRVASGVEGKGVPEWVARVDTPDALAGADRRRSERSHRSVRPLERPMRRRPRSRFRSR